MDVDFYKNLLFIATIVVNTLAIFISGLNIFIYLRHKELRNFAKKWIFYLSINIFAFAFF